jgi:hypothetical protein
VHPAALVVFQTLPDGRFAVNELNVLLGLLVGGGGLVALLLAAVVAKLRERAEGARHV